MEPYRWLRRDLKRFAVEFLCLSMLLQGYPAQALEEHATKAPSQTESVADRPTRGPVLAKVREQAGRAVDATATATLTGLGQPWGSALGLLLGLSSLAIPQDETAASLEVSADSAVEPPQDSTAPAETREPGAIPSTVAPPPAIRLATKVRRADATAIQRVERRARRVDAGSVPPARPAAVSPSPAPRRTNKTTSAEISALANELGSPAAILRHVHDTIRFDPKHGADSPPLGTLRERRGTAWDQAWLLQELLRALGVDARLEWGEVEITPALLTTLAGVDGPVRAADLLTTAGTPVVLVIGGSEVIAARLPHVWVKAHLDYIPNRGLTHGTPDTWIRMDPTLKDHPVSEGQRLDQAVPYVLADHLASGTEQSPRQDYEVALVAEAGTSDLDSLKPLRTLRAENFPFVPGTLRAKVLSVDGESETVPDSKQVRLEVTAREPGGDALFSWSTQLPSIYGEALELRWQGATSADQANLDLYGGIYTTPPFEVELAGELRLAGSTVAGGGSIGAAENIELIVTITPPDGAVATTARWDLFAGEHAVLGFDLGHTPEEVADRFEQRADAATTADDREANQLAAAAATYFRHLGDDLDHLGALRWHRVVPLATAVLAVQRGAVSTFPNGSPETFSRGPLSLDLGAMPLGIFPADGTAVELRPTTELLGAQASVREGEALATVFGGEHPTAVGFLKRAVREDQELTRVDAGNLEATLADAELGDDAEAAVRDAVERGKIAWVAEQQIEINGWQTSGYVVQEPGTGLGGYHVAFERRLSALEGAVTFHAPQDLDVVTAPTDVVATIDAEGLQSWTLATRPVGSSNGTVIATGTGPVDNATLGQLDPTLLLNGLHELILTGTDAASQTFSGRVAVSVEGNMKIGHFTLSFVDLAIPVSGLDIEVIRTYDSRQRLEHGDFASHDFGPGWTLDIRQGSYRNNRPPGDGWQIPGTEGPWGLPCSTVNETKSHLTTVRLSDQEVYRFRLTLQNPATVIGGCYADAVFEWVDGPLPGTTLDVLGATQVFVATGSDRAVLPDTQEPFVPEDVKLTTRDGRIFHLDLTDGVTHLEDLNGNFLDITPEGITHSSGKGIDFTRDEAGRIVTITDPMGYSNRYAYDEAGDLVSFTDRVDAVTRFTYTGEHYLEDIENALGVRAVRTEYDADGRVARMIDADGKIVALDHELAGRREVITNRLGFVRVLEYDERGNVVREVDELGNATTRTYDGRDNLLSETDPLGRVTTSEYTATGYRSRRIEPLARTVEIDFNDLGLPTLVRNAQGQESRHHYDSLGNLLESVDPLGSSSWLRYDASGRVRQLEDTLGHVHHFVTSPTGEVTTWTPPAGSAVHYTYDDNGQLLIETRRRLVAGQEETIATAYEYDAMGRHLAVWHPDGSSERLEYDLLGRLVASTDAAGNRTQFGYDVLDRRVRIVLPDGSEQTMSYDDEGRLVLWVEPEGRTWRFGYDAVGRQTFVEAPDGGRKAFEYDAGDQLILLRDELGHETTFHYDAAGRRTAQVDPLGNTTSWAYDTLDRVTSVTDPNGNTTIYEYDALGHQTKTRLADGSVEESAYDSMGRQARQTTVNGVETLYTRDSLGRLIEAEVAGETTEYHWDELGNLVEIVDALGRSTRLDYDSRGRLRARTLPDGTSESWTYSPWGAVATHVRLGGGIRSFEYDSRQRLVEWTDSEGDWARFSYGPAGHLSTAENGSGVVQLDFDPVGRLIRKTDPNGHQIEYLYDLAGRQSRLTATLDGIEVSTSFTYDAAGRVTSLFDTEGGQYHFQYDSMGNRTRIVYPNGVTTERIFDFGGRPDSILTRSSDGTTLLGLDYVRSPGGRIEQVGREGVGLTRYEYGASGELTREEVLDPVGALVRRASYTHDAVGNRSSAFFERASADSIAISYQYDARDRLLSAGTGTWSWDADGRLSQHGGTSYSWSSEQMSESVAPDGTLTRLDYDALGERLSTSIELGGVVEGTESLVDDSASLSQVVADLTGVGLTSWTRVGGELLAIHGVDGSHFYHGDALGSILALTDGQGEVSDEYTFDAFGVLEEHVGDSSQPYGFAGELFSESLGLAHHRARWLDPEIGRFVSPDPFSGVLEIPWTLNAYPYVAGDPINARDPSGRIPDWLVPIIVGSAVHRAIGADFVENAIPAFSGLSDRTINTILGDGSLCYRAESQRDCRRRPDLVNRVSYEVYEIKTRSEQVAGQRQLGEYLALLHNYDRYAYRSWQAGVSYEPPASIEVQALMGYWAVTIDDPQFGVITYKVEDGRFRLRPPSVPLVILSLAILTSIQMAIASRGAYV